VSGCVELVRRGDLWYECGRCVVCRGARSANSGLGFAAACVVGGVSLLSITKTYPVDRRPLLDESGNPERRLMTDRLCRIVSGRLNVSGRRDPEAVELLGGCLWAVCPDFGDIAEGFHHHAYIGRRFANALESLDWAARVEAYLKRSDPEGFWCVRLVFDASSDKVVEYVSRHSSLKLLPEVRERLEALRVELPRTRYGRAFGGRFGLLADWFTEASGVALSRGAEDVAPVLEVRGKRFAVPTSLRAKARARLGLPRTSERRQWLADLRRSFRMTAAHRAEVERRGAVSSAVAVRVVKERRRRNAERLTRRTSP
jgi:hypothetical protein